MSPRYEGKRKHTPFSIDIPSLSAGQQAREDRCRVGEAVHRGGPQVRTLAQSALAGSDADRRGALTGNSAQQTPLGQAAAQDRDNSPPPWMFPTQQQQRWLDEINKFDYQNNPP